MPTRERFDEPSADYSRRVVSRIETFLGKRKTYDNRGLMSGPERKSGIWRGPWLLVRRVERVEAWGGYPKMVLRQLRYRLTMMLQQLGFIASKKTNVVEGRQW